MFGICLYVHASVYLYACTEDYAYEYVYAYVHVMRIRMSWVCVYVYAYVLMYLRMCLRMCMSLRMCMLPHIWQGAGTQSQQNYGEWGKRHRESERE